MVTHYLRQFINLFTNLLFFALFLRVIFSWIRIAPYSALYRVVFEITEPILGIFRRIVPPLGGALDISPIFAFFAIDILRSLVLKFLV